jgi:hypothetical protein
MDVGSVGIKGRIADDYRCTDGWSTCRCNELDIQHDGSTLNINWKVKERIDKGHHSSYNPGIVAPKRAGVDLDICAVESIDGAAMAINAKASVGIKDRIMDNQRPSIIKNGSASLK